MGIALLKVLAARGIAVPDSVRDRVMQCEDRDEMDELVDKAMTVNEAHELFA
jgi:hypothetical protein